MVLAGLVSLVREAESVRRIVRGFSEVPSEQMVVGVTGSQKSTLVAALFEELNGRAQEPLPVLVLTHTRTTAERWRDDLLHLVGEERVGYFPAVETLPHEEVSPSPELVGQRLDALMRLAGAGRPVSVVVAEVTAATERLVPADVLARHVHRIRVGDRRDPAELARALTAAGYERRTKVQGPGQLSLRGDILDCLPLDRSAGVRIEWFDDVVESIRLFDVESQRSAGHLEEVVLGPAREFLLPGDGPGEGLARLEASARRQAQRLRAVGKEEEAQKLLDRTGAHLERISQQGYVEGADQYRPLFFGRLPLLPEYGAPALVVLDDPSRLKERVSAAQTEWSETFTSLLERGRVLPEEDRVFGWWDDLVRASRRSRTLYLTLLPRRLAETEPQHVHSLPVRPADSFHGNWQLLADELRNRQRQRFRVLLALSGQGRAERVREGLVGESVPAILSERLDGQLKPGNVVVVPAPLESGFELAELRLLVLTEAEVYGTPRRPARRARTAPTEAGARITDYLELREGDYVVHVNHGIGRYQGIQTMDVAGVRRDYLVVRYAGEDRLYVPTDQVHLLQKYIGSDDEPPKLHRLGGGEWARVKKRVEESVHEMARSLLELYAARQAQPGIAFGPDSPWQREFEEAFPYEETPDQLRATEEVKRDMERPRPMDRLLCGDVGYGKTEVAMRAAFKAVADGRQVAVLVPTTILAQQHYRTFSERMAGYPVRLEMLSRFQSASEQAAIIEGLRLGTIDVVIGTHRLLSKDVQFKNLGLVIVDEEQRFGVAQKERLKELRRTVDVLTMTATPIPRTLHMALSGLRDMSVIETPPEGRYPVRTYVVEFQDDLIRDAITRELARQGQVYFVYNRVQTIDRMAAHVQALVPEARVAVAHGQMDESRLEQVMLDFLNGQYDVLVCTTIIETGMDIGNVNTLIVYDADRMGLAQLYQLRGRVGRSHRVAYAYFTYRKERVLSEDAERRLEAIREFTELGSGFKIALRDLEIRGAGNLLGPEQHGHIASVGFEMYCRLLEEAVREVKGETVQKPPEPVLDLSVDAYLPDEYVPDAAQKVEFYRRIAAAEGYDEIEAIAADLRDRFGELPVSVEHLLEVARLKLLARETGVATITLERDSAAVKAWPGIQLPPVGVARAASMLRGRLSFRPNRTDVVWLRRAGLDDGQLLAALRTLLEQVREAWPQAKGVEATVSGGVKS
ncbi:transcription-repair coupling factor [Carboxydochorda subterranea]|uniref:Transcription-repair-coupling factor n=1 Tax=Carboxydichorda subterranea TaxID=3109565 RepID=A0ABZ1BWP7_9FIRM|nr:transcription-repair coupling factor [Limnochorda sp. L945t]WRP17013.1 transcription-repair coupling factor [Limnochorda sp. L945t]